MGSDEQVRIVKAEVQEGAGNKAVFSLSPYYSGRIIYIAKDITQYIKPELGVHGHVKRYTVNYAGMSQLLSSVDNVGQKRGASIYGEPIRKIEGLVCIGWDTITLRESTLSPTK